MAAQQYGTICTAGSRKCFVRRYIPLHRPTRYICVVIVAALMYQLSPSAVLLVVHNRYLGYEHLLPDFPVSLRYRQHTVIQMCNSFAVLRHIQIMGNHNDCVSHIV